MVIDDAYFYVEMQDICSIGSGVLTTPGTTFSNQEYVVHDGNMSLSAFDKFTSYPVFCPLRYVL